LARRQRDGVFASRLNRKGLPVEAPGRDVKTPEDGFSVETPENHLQAVAPGMWTPEDRLRRLEIREEKT